MLRAATAITATFLAVGLLTACGDGEGSAKPASPSSASPRSSSTTPDETPTEAASYDPEEWDFRVGLITEDLDVAQPTCKRHPSSSTCADALKKAHDELQEMDTALTDSGDAALYPATTDHLQTIFEGYDDYVAGGCEGDPAADEFGSDCRVAMAQVSLGAATLPVKMAADG